MYKRRARGAKEKEEEEEEEQEEEQEEEEEEEIPERVLPDGSTWKIFYVRTEGGIPRQPLQLVPVKRTRTS